jgi:cyclic beta-1,2-glucan synthetase
VTSRVEDEEATRCPALDAHARWDELEFLRGPILSPLRLADHARELARVHGTQARRGRPGLVFVRFQHTRERLEQAYAILARDVRASREPTPAEEWLLDNAHIVEDQLREVAVDLPRGYLAKLPRLAEGAMRGIPRVYGLCLDYLRHTDARVEPDSLIAYVSAYQSVSPLTIGELWAVPIMLRIGLLMMVAHVASQEAADRSVPEARSLATELAGAAEPLALLAPFDQRTVSASFLVELKRKVLEHEHDSGAVLAWIGKRALSLGHSAEELGRLHHLHRAEDQLTVGNAITSMRAISAYDWTRFFENTSLVEAVLVTDPGDMYARSDAQTRDRIRHVVEQIAHSAQRDEREVARAAVQLAELAAREGDPNPAHMHVGYYLLDRGRPALERALGARPPFAVRARRMLEQHGSVLYGSALLLGTLGLAWLVHVWLLALGTPPLARFALLALLLVAISEVAIGLVNSAVMALMPPRLLAKLDFKGGIAREQRTLVVVPALLDSAETVQRLLEDLEIRALANMEEHLYFALLTDFCDASEQSRPEDQALLTAALAGIERLNQRHPAADYPRFSLLHRHRLYNASERRYMGWERKRGKLEELNRLILGDNRTSFAHVTCPHALLHGVRYVITLDADTELPRGSARKLVAAMAHPLNRPRFDKKLRRVVSGYGIIQPRVGVAPQSSRRSWYARVFAGAPGIDPYTTAVSDVYQDLFGEGSFVGKGIYDVSAFAAALEGRVPENALLSHDLFEGLFARCALASDIEVLDDQPAAYGVEAGRRHRWMRGDFQLLPWILRERQLPAYSRWKMIDNLRRAFLAPSLVLALVLALALHPAALPALVLSVLAVALCPACVRLFASLVRPPARDRSVVRWPLVWGDLWSNTLRGLVSLAFLLEGALLAVDAIARTLYRLTVSRRHLLEWTTTGQAERLFRQRRLDTSPRLLLSAGLALALAALSLLRSPQAFAWLAPLCALWSAAPLISSWLSRPLPRRRAVPLAARERAYARRVARKTWRFFETFVGAEDNWLPPDNYQEEPRGVVAHRTSPTNVGLYMLSCLSARDLGFLTVRELVERLSATLDAVERLETYRGHLLNWYDTTTLAPLSPKYVSMVDSGNLLGHLWTLAAGLRELTRQSLRDASWLDAVEDALLLAEEGGAPGASSLSLLQTARSEDEPSLVSSLRRLRAVCAGLPSVRADERGQSEGSYWLGEARSTAQAWLDELEALLPFAELLERVPNELKDDAEFSALATRLCALTTLEELARCASRESEVLRKLLDHRAGAAQAEYVAELRTRLERTAAAAASLSLRLEREAARATAVAERMEFGFLYDEDRSLFSIGFNVDLGRLDGSRYDLLASEARLGSFVAVARGEVSNEHWFHLGRTRVRVGPRAALVSWSGSMFEFMMPLLVMRRCEGTLLDETYVSVVDAQRRYGEACGVPWGISESAYNVMDLHMTYQYRAFGVPSLGLKAGLADDLVIAPYATALAALVCPREALANFQVLSREGCEGPCGFYEASDYTRERVPPGRRSVVVKAYMAHHQGMTLLALAGVLLDHPMRRRFHGDPRVKATELLLEERAPLGVPPIKKRVIQSETQALSDEELSHVERVTLGDEPLMRAHLLGHGELSTLVGARGFGFTTWKNLDVNRFREDATAASGLFVYVRNRATGRFWSVGHEPVRARADAYCTELSPDKVRIQRRDEHIESAMEIVVSPEYPAELRRITLVNHGDSTVQLDVTTYTELALAPRAADLAHRAFGNLFVRTEALPDGRGVIATRKPRKRGDFAPWCLQMLTADSPQAGGALEWETSRLAFLGRGPGYQQPAALLSLAPLSGSTGSVLDPAIALRRTVTLAPGARVQLTLTTALSDSRAGLLSVADALSAASGVTRSFELAWADARVELKHLGISGLTSHRFQRLLSALLFPEPGLRSREPAGGASGLGVLWSLGISGDLPLLVVRLDDLELTDLVHEVLLAHEFFRLNNVAVDLLLLDEEPGGYFAPVHDRALQAVRATASQGLLDQRGGVFVRCASRLTARERALVLSAARVVLAVSQGSLARQLRRGAGPLPATTLPAEPLRKSASLVVPQTELAFDNGFGGFSSDGREYVIRVVPGKRTPRPWSNVMAQPDFGTLVTEAGGGFTWAGNSQRHRLTPWSNDAVLDPPGEVIYVRDEASGAFFSATPTPRPEGASYLVRHGQGYSVFESQASGLSTSLTVFLDPGARSKVSWLHLENRSDTPRRLAVFGFVDWVLGAQRDKSRHTLVTELDAQSGALVASNAFSAYPERAAFFVASRELASASADRTEFVGADGSLERPRGLALSRLSGISGSGLDPCGALHVALELAPGAAADVAFVLGESASPAEAQAQARRYAGLDCAALFAASRAPWDELLGAVTVETPDRALDTMVNRWLLYQTLSCRIWGRSGFYQSGGAYGYRDQLQDVLALVHSRPELCREHLLRAASRQFLEGDVQHWWHPETGEGVRTHCSDDMLWLPFSLLHYLRVTGDAAVLEEQVPFLEERVLDPDDHDLYSVPRVSSQHASLYEHARRALLNGSTRGKHGIPLMRGGDWNDGMDRVGAAGLGESVWLGWFLAALWRDFGALAKSRGDHELAERARAEVTRLGEAIDTHAWDGSWYRRAFCDDGSALGSARSPACRIDAIAQSWAELSGVAKPERARQALDSALAQLLRPEPGIMLLLWPPFTELTTPDPGYIAAYPPGIRENGGQYTHGVLWTVQALLAQGRSEEGHALLATLNPISQGSERSAVERYQVEPYVVTADVYASPEHMGKGGWSWYTGAAGWFYRIALEDLLGIQVRGEQLAFRPRVPRSWRGFSVTYRRGDARYTIRFENPDGVDVGEAELEAQLDGQLVAASRIPFAADGREHEVRVRARAAALREARRA